MYILVNQSVLQLIQRCLLKGSTVTDLNPTKLPPGVEISFIAMPLTVGDSVSIVCSANLAATTIEWIRDGITVDAAAMDNSSNQSLTLVLDPVSANHHNTQYTCRVTSPYDDSVLEETVNITVQSKL